MICRPKDETDPLFYFLCWQNVRTAPIPMWAFRASHDIDGSGERQMINSVTGEVITIKQGDWLLFHKLEKVVIALDADAFSKSMEILEEQSGPLAKPDESKPGNQTPA